MKVLIIEDDVNTSKALCLALNTAGYVCHTSPCGEEGVHVCRSHNYDLVILDVALPDLTGYEVTYQLRKRQVKTPIMILTSYTSTEHKVKGFGFGADDFVCKPWNNSELLARIHALIRRSKGHAQSIIKIGKHLAIDTENKTVQVKGKCMHLTTKEYALLELLALYKSSLVTKEYILSYLYCHSQQDSPSSLKIIDVFTCKLRRKLFEHTGKNYIHTVWGRGYRIDDGEEDEGCGDSKPIESDEDNDEVDDLPHIEVTVENGQVVRKSPNNA